MQRLVIRLDEKIKKLKNMMENMLEIHNMQMEKIIKMITEISEESVNNGKQMKRNSLDFTFEDNEFY